MADLKTIAESLKVEINYERPRGKKRRSWITSDSDSVAPQPDMVYRPFHELGSIDTFDQPSQKRPIDPIDQPYPHDEIYKPYPYGLKNLRQNPLKLVNYFFVLSNEDPQRITSKLTRTKIEKDLNISINSVKTALKFLSKNNLIEIVSSVRGGAGWSQYKLKDALFEEIKHAYEIGSIDPVYISSSNIKTTTTKIDPIHKGLEKIDIEPLKDVGFKVDHLTQIVRSSALTSDMVQDSIYAFAFDLNHNDKRKTIKGDPLNFFMGILSRGRPYSRPSNFVHPDEEAMQSYLKAKGEELRRKQEFEATARELEFKKWYSELSDDEIQELTSQVGEEVGMPPRVKQGLKLRHLEKCFKEEVWPVVYADILRRRR